LATLLLLTNGHIACAVDDLGKQFAGLLVALFCGLAKAPNTGLCRCSSGGCRTVITLYIIQGVSIRLSGASMRIISSAIPALHLTVKLKQCLAVNEDSECRHALSCRPASRQMNCQRLHCPH
jgi:hypothetical protein